MYFIIIALYITNNNGNGASTISYWVSILYCEGVSKIWLEELNEIINNIIINNIINNNNNKLLILPILLLLLQI